VFSLSRRGGLSLAQPVDICLVFRYTTPNRYPATWGVGYSAIMLLRSFSAGIRSLLCLAAVFADFTPLRMAAYHFTLCFLSVSRLWHHCVRSKAPDSQCTVNIRRNPSSLEIHIATHFILYKASVSKVRKEALSRALVQTPPD